MGAICILTDSAVQFTQPGFAGREVVRVIPYGVSLHGTIYQEGDTLKSTSLPLSAGDNLSPGLIVPSPAQFLQTIQGIANQHRELLVILSSREITGIYSAAEQAIIAARGQLPIVVVDSQTTSIGLGMLVQIAAEAAARGARMAEIENIVRKAITRTYSLFCPAGLSYLSYSGFLDDAQANVGELLGILPIFSIEEGKFSPIEKARNLRGTLEFFQEFMTEFDDLQQIALLQGAAPFNHEAHILREQAQIHFPRTPFSEHTINLPVATLLGPRTLGLVIMEAD